MKLKKHSRCPIRVSLSLTQKGLANSPSTIRLFRHDVISPRHELQNHANITDRRRQPRAQASPFRFWIIGLKPFSQIQLSPTDCRFKSAKLFIILKIPLAVFQISCFTLRSSPLLPHHQYIQPLFYNSHFGTLEKKIIVIKIIIIIKKVK